MRETAAGKQKIPPPAELPGPVRTTMESLFNDSFANVKLLPTGTTAHAGDGEVIYFDPQTYDDRSVEGLVRIAQKLHGVVQNRLQASPHAGAHPTASAQPSRAQLAQELPKLKEALIKEDHQKLSVLSHLKQGANQRDSRRRHFAMQKDRRFLNRPVGTPVIPRRPGAHGRPV
ncbi:MAG: hypothetical protein ETSY1_31485 [Candidatus Entotheonella factor]|uniref:Uncharacterized protein n=1 Tax=Entotheonella factor TaxID=1429438 RepID=W4LBX3_ENTF1|nr:MAG: hypothetical protein ETSY1_31485 [Candidatus Entotheonella factor]